MNRILGLDLGTNSIGWAIVDKDSEEFTLVDKGVRIFSEGVNIEAKTSSESSKASQRTDYRSARKLKYRRKIRKIDLLQILSDNNLCPKLSKDDLDNWRYKRIYPQNEDFRTWLLTDNQENEDDRKTQIKNPYYFRYIASTQILNLNNTVNRFDLGRAFYHIAQRRGFLSNRLDNSDNSIIEEKNSDIEALINESNTAQEFIQSYNDFLESYDKDEDDTKALFTMGRGFSSILKENSNIRFEDIKEKLSERLNRKEFLGKVKRAINDLSEKIENANCNTLGEYFYVLHKSGYKIRGEYTHREQHYLSEFNTICEKQNIPADLKNALKEAIFFQRPLKSQKGLIAKCPLENRKSCIPISHPAFEEFRMLSFINNIKIKKIEDKKLRVLTNEEKSLIIPLFYRKSKPNFDFEDIAKQLTPKNLRSGYFKDKNVNDYDILLNYGFYTNVPACPTIANFRDIFGHNWKQYLTDNFNKLNKDGSTKTEDEIIDAVWHVLFRFDKIEKLKEFALSYLSCDEKIATKFSKIKLKQNYGSLSLKAIRNILPYLQQGLLYSHAVFLANMKNILPLKIWNDEINRNTINNEIISIIENYKKYNDSVEIVNGLIRNAKNENETWNENAFVIETYKKNLIKKVETFFGYDKWNSFSDQQKQKTIEEGFKLFINQMKLNSGRGEFLKKETIDEKIKEFLYNNFNIAEDQLKKLYHPSAIEIYKKVKRNEEDGKLYLGSPVISSIKNPMAMKALHQLRKVLNQLIKDDLIDEKTIVHIEMARELNSVNERVAIRQWQNDLQSKRKKNIENIKEIYREQFSLEIEPSEDEILKFQLWEEQNKICLYTGNTIRISDFIGSNPKFDIEHTIPRSKSLDNSQINKTLCLSSYNRDIKKDKIPTVCPNHNEILQRIKHWYAKYKDLEIQIKNLSKKVKASSTKEQKDRYIQQRTKLRFEYNYYFKKYKTFTIEEIPDGFKNSQSVDIGIISKYGNLFLKSLFEKVYPIKGKTTSNLREMWGLEKKERINHAHHAKDAVVVACCTRDINDALANYFHEYEEYQFYGKSKPSFSHRIPWNGFSNDVKLFDENILISHHTSDVFSSKGKKAIRKKGIIQRNEKGEIKYKQGDSVRASLHKDSFYGAIKREIINQKSGESEEVIKYVLRKSLDKFSESDINNIVDKTIKEIIIKGRSQEKIIKKEIEELKAKIKTANEIEEQKLKYEINVLEEKIKNKLYILPNKKGLAIPIKKVRYFTGDVSNPLKIKKHRDLSRHDYKKYVFAKNDGNYCYVLYEGKDKKGKMLNEVKVVNNFEAGKYFNFKENIHKYPVEYNIEHKNKSILGIKYVLKIGTLVLFYKETKEEVWELGNTDLAKRLYKVIGIEEDGRVQLRLHSTSKQDKDLEKVSSVNFEIPNEKLRLSKTGLTILVEGFDFKITTTGKIIKPKMFI